MKKTFLAAMALIVAFSFSACEVLEPTKEELLTQKNGWIMLTATSNPAYENNDGIKSENLFVSYFDACELDDVLYFHTDKSSFMHYGKLSCEWDEAGDKVSLGNWRFIKDEEVLEFHLPFLFDENDNFALLEGKVIVLDKNTLQLRIPVTFDDDPAKSSNRRGRVVKTIPAGSKIEPQFQWTITYRVN